MRIFKSFGYLLTVLLVGFSSASQGAIRVGYSRQSPADSHMIVVRRHSTYWVEPVRGQGRIRITVPIEFYLSSWDVKALERELERLGIKVRPKPVPKPKPVVSG